MKNILLTLILSTLTTHFAHAIEGSLSVQGTLPVGAKLEKISAEYSEAFFNRKKEVTGSISTNSSGQFKGSVSYVDRTGNNAYNFELDRLTLKFSFIRSDLGKNHTEYYFIYFYPSSQTPALSKNNVSTLCGSYYDSLYHICGVNFFKIGYAKNIITNWTVKLNPFDSAIVSNNAIAKIVEVQAWDTRFTIYKNKNKIIGPGSALKVEPIQKKSIIESRYYRVLESEDHFDGELDLKSAFTDKSGRHRVFNLHSGDSIFVFNSKCNTSSSLKTYIEIKDEVFNPKYKKEYCNFN